jgi:WD40 repeat protein
LFGHRTQTIDIAAYEHGLGGLNAIVRGAGERAVAEVAVRLGQPDSRAEVERLLAAAFVPHLVSVDALTREAKARTAELKAIPPEAHGLIQKLVDARLLNLDRFDMQGKETASVRVAHESIFRQWPDLAAIVGREQDKLIQLDSIQRSALEWSRNERRPEWLEHQGERLREAASLRASPSLQAAMDDSATSYLQACIDQEKERTEAERARAERELNEIRRTKRFQLIAGALLLIVTGLVAAGLYSTLQVGHAQAARASAMLAQMSADWNDIGLRDRAARLALAATQNPLPFLTLDAAGAEAALRRALTEQYTSTTLLGHEGVVTSANFSPSGKLILTTSFDRSARLWDAISGKQIGAAMMHGGYVLSGAFSPDEETFATGGNEGILRLWSTASGRTSGEFPREQTTLSAVAFSPDGAFVAGGSYAGTITIWNIRQRAVLRKLEGHGGAITSIDFSSDGKWLISGSTDRTARIWDVASGVMRHQLPDHASTVWSVAFSPVSTRAVTSDETGARMWEFATRNPVRPLEAHRASVTGVRFSPDGTLLATASQDGSTRLWHVATRSEVLRLRGHIGAVNTVAFSPDGSRVVTTGDDGTARIWQLPKELTITREKTLLDVDFGERGLLLACEDGYAYLVEASSGREIARLGNGKGHVIRATLSPDTTHAALATKDGQLSLWNIADAKLERVLSARAETIRSLRYSPSGRQLLVAYADGNLRLWDTGNGAIVATVLHDAAGATSGAFSPDGMTIASAGGDAIVRLWDARTLQPIRSFEGHSKPVNTAEFSADGRLLVSASIDGTARIWDLSSGRALRALEGHGRNVNTAAFSPDGRKIVTASEDHTVRIWSTDTGTETTRFTGDVEVTSAQFTPDGASIVVLSKEFGLRRMSLADYADPRLDELHGTALLDYACKRYFARGLDALDGYERATVSRLTFNRSGSVCSQARFMDYLAYAFGL